MVIGAGINGLVAAWYLRRQGFTVTIIERAARAGGACVSDVATVSGRSQHYALGASVLGLMQDFVFRDTGLAKRLDTHVPEHAKRVHFPDGAASAWIFRDARALERELATKWGESGDVAAFRADEASVVAYLRDGYRTAIPPTLETAKARLGETLTKLWITGTAAALLDHYFTAERTKIYMGMTITESGPVSLHEPYSAFTLPLMDSGSVFDGYYGFVNPGLWRLTEELAAINREAGIQIQLDSRVDAVDAARGEVRYTKDGEDRIEAFDELLLATDPLTAARLVGDASLIQTVQAKRLLGTSGKLTLFFERPVRWTGESPTADSAFRFIFSVDSVAEFERATLKVTAGDVDYAPGYIQIYCEGAAMRQLGVHEPFDRLTLFFKNVALTRPGEALADVEAEVKAQVLSRVDNPEDCVWSRLLAPRDLQQLFLFPGGNLDHTMLVGGQTFFDRQYAVDPREHFYAFGSLANVSYCGAGAYPCGSIAGTPGFMCAEQVIRRLTR